MDLIKKVQELKNNSLSPVENVEKCLDEIKKQKSLNAFLEINESALAQAKELESTKKRGPLFGLTVSVKANINVFGLTASCASKTLQKYVAPYDADVIKKLKDAGAIILGMTNCDEFASGASGEHSAFGVTQNPVAPGFISGGSSSGSAVAVAANLCDFSLGSDTGGSIRNPASHCGIVGIKPSYGLVSRYGLIDLSMGLDQIGPFSRSVSGAALVLESLQGKSSNDATSIISQNTEYVKNITNFKNVTIGVSDDLLKLCKDDKILALFNQTKEKLEKLGCSFKNVSLSHIDLAIQTYYLLVYVEFFSATRKFDGRKYGLKIEESCGEEVLRRILGGKIITQAEFKGAYYKKALAVKNLIREEFTKAFIGVDTILSPTVPRLPHKLGDNISVEEMYAYDAFTTPANLAGICGGSVNSGFINNIPVGMQVLAPWCKEANMFKILRAIENGN